MEPDGIASLLENLQLQFSYYDDHGFKGRQKGKAVQHAMFAGSAARAAREA